MVKIDEHFNQQHQEYINSVNGTNKEWYQNINKLLIPELKGRILDIGNGGVFTYDVSLFPEIIALDISFKDNTKLQSFSNVSYVNDDARTLKKIPNNSCDTVLLQFVIHHITGRKYIQTIKYLNEVLENSKRVLKPGGKIIVIETIVKNFIELFEKHLFKLTYISLKFFNTPMVFMYSKRTILDSMVNKYFKEITYKIVPYGKKIDVCNGLKPGILIIPSWISPHRCYFFTAIKNG